ncbi:efflux RND transporter periplasmic adaptor subunit [Methylocystis bryophila]|uniref:efflux RND transporter periplasmic adaptor subunit n=1 Tax=Methylocystis bryophila TaxID=655015 RepID=UPI000A26B4B9|nr:HlyD family secretion protein [Methylocystis bryophila]BDV40198.1 membrane protein [Methylocystis bryophila]
MTADETKAKSAEAPHQRDPVWAPHLAARPHFRLAPFLLTAVTAGLAAAFGWAMWDAYMGAPWTRDGSVRAYVVALAPEVAGQIVEFPVKDNQFVHKGDRLMLIDPRDFRIAVSHSEAAVKQAKATLENTEIEAKRRQKLVKDVSISVEEEETYATKAIASRAQYEQALADLDQAKVNLERTEVRAPVNGWVTNLLAQRGDYAHVGQNVISLVDADSFWVDGYFEEIYLDQIHVGDPAEIKLMSYRPTLRGHVNSIARAINVPNAQPNHQGIASVNPIFTWVRLAQRIPVRVHIDEAPKGVALSAGMTATVQVNPATPARSK